MPDIRHELHYNSRLIRCLVPRPPNIDAMMREAAMHHPQGPAIIDGATRLNYTQLDALVNRLAGNLADRGIKHGDRVATLLDNGVAAVALMLASARLGAILVAMNVRQRAPETEYMLNHSGAVVLVHEATLADYLPAPEATPSVRHRFAVGTTPAGSLPYDLLLKEERFDQVTVVAEDDPFCILYTSGTTGRPKGAVLTHFGVVHSCLNYQTGLGLRHGERTILAVPASHVTGLVGVILAMIRVAGTIVMAPPFKASAFLDLVAKERVTYSLMVPAMYNLCVREPDFATRDLASWRVGGFGGAPMPEATILTLANKLPHLALHNIYGSTETTSPVTILPSQAIATHPDSVGRSLPCCDIRVMDDAGVEVPPGTGGELWIAGPMVVPRYWQDPDATSRGFVHGYWRSGDIGSVDAEGYVRVFDRKKDVINRGGYKIYSIEVENVLTHHPAIAEAAVVARPCPILGERVEAFIVTKQANVLTTADVRAFCAERLSDYKVPDYVTILETPLPRNANGKLQKTLLRTQAEGAQTPS